MAYRYCCSGVKFTAVVLCFSAAVIALLYASQWPDPEIRTIQQQKFDAVLQARDALVKLREVDPETYAALWDRGPLALASVPPAKAVSPHQPPTLIRTCGGPGGNQYTDAEVSAAIAQGLKHKYNPIGPSKKGTYALLLKRHCRNIYTDACSMGQWPEDTLMPLTTENL